MTDHAASSGRYRVILTCLYFASFLGLGVVTAILGSAIPSMAVNTNSTLSNISILFIARYLGYMIGSIWAGKLYDHRNGHTIMAVSMLLISLMAFMAPYASVLPLLAAIIFALGIAQGGLDVGGNTLILWLYGNNAHAYMITLHLFFGIGSSLAPLLVSFSLDRHNSINIAFMICSILFLPQIMILPFYASPRIKRQESQVAQPTAMKWLMLQASLIFFLYIGAEASFGGWIYTYSLQSGLVSTKAAAYLNSAFWFSITIGRLIVIPISLRIAPIKILVTDLICAIICITYLLLAHETAYQLALGICGSGLFMATIFPNLMNFINERFPISSRMTGYFLIGSNAGAMLIPFAIGILMKATGRKALFVTVLVNLIFAQFILFNLTAKLSRNQSNTSQ